MIEYTSIRLSGQRIRDSEFVWSQLPVTISFDDLNYNMFLYRINDKVYNYNSKLFRKAFDKARVWELLAQ